MDLPTSQILVFLVSAAIFLFLKSGLESNLSTILSIVLLTNAYAWEITSSMLFFFVAIRTFNLFFTFFFHVLDFSTFELIAHLLLSAFWYVSIPIYSEYWSFLSFIAAFLCVQLFSPYFFHVSFRFQLIFSFGTISLSNGLYLRNLGYFL